MALAQHHSLWYQLLILWGLPVLLTVLLILSVITEKMKGLKHKSLYRLLEAITVPDLFAVIMGLCAIGLVLIPELVYVRDIYENGNARANTMFKLTYQAYILFGMTMGYGIYRMLVISRQKIIRILSGVGLLYCSGPWAISEMPCIPGLGMSGRFQSIRDWMQLHFLSRIFRRMRRQSAG